MQPNIILTKIMVKCEWNISKTFCLIYVYTCLCGCTWYVYRYMEEECGDQIP